MREASGSPAQPSAPTPTTVTGGGAADAGAGLLTGWNPTGRSPGLRAGGTTDGAPGGPPLDVTLPRTFPAVRRSVRSRPPRA
ncbi:hypothetical protein GCM10010393_01320 [Streptomyces gobitricini]|uniref:Uncharacterized protein n=1 Tax=Streptomyces gobitricini TaxID=68211 RepID=A0ABN3L3B8_9ACTN